MRPLVRAFFIAGFAVLAFVIAHHDASAEVMVSAEVPAFTDMYVGATYEVTVTQSTGAMDGDLYTIGDVTVIGLDGTGAAQSDASLYNIPAGTSQEFTVTVTVNDALLSKCTSGSLAWSTSAVFLSFSDDMYFGYDSVDGTTPCSVRSAPVLTPVEVVPPEVTAFGCGIGDDTVTLYDQPTGVTQPFDSDWMDGGSRYISYTAAPGYEISNDTDYYFFDEVDTCEPTTPVVTPEPTAEATATPDPTVEATATPDPTVEATVTPSATVAPTNDASEQASDSITTPVTSLPETGTGSGTGVSIIAFGIAASLLLGAWTAFIRRNSVG